MKNFRIRSLGYILFFILLCGCADSDPYIGKWESSHGREALEFTKSEMTTISSKGAVQIQKVKYKKEGNNWLISIDDGKTYISSLEFKDKNTMILKEHGVELKFKKVQSYFEVIIDGVSVFFGLILWVIRGIIDIIMSVFRMLMQLF